MLFLGIDIAGAKNSWVCELSWDKKKLFLEIPPYQIAALDEILNLVQKKVFLGCAIDAPLTYSSSTRKWRISDIALRCLLKENKNWVQSPNSMQAVPLRAQQLVSFISPYVGSIIETHPRASLFFMLEKEPLLKKYKTSPNALKILIEKTLAILPKVLNVEIKILPETIVSDGALDAFICAIIAFLYFYMPDKLYRLPLENNLRGIGPFYIFKPSCLEEPLEIKYTPGNYGDVLKQSWLIAIVNWLLKYTKHFHYADTFCGFPIYKTKPEIILSFEERWSYLPLYHLQKSYLKNCQYAGSAWLVKEICEKKKKDYCIDFYDKNKKAILAYERLLNKPALKINDGYDILIQKQPYDLIFLDPYADFWHIWQKVIEKILYKQNNSSILLFIPWKPEEKNYFKLCHFLEEKKTTYIHQSLTSLTCLQETGYFFSIFFFPKSSLSKKEIKTIPSITII
ncbi:MAG TPA: DUF429 domain-containing protein [Candidatus Desulfofervidus auxilii]|uniref:DUF429 domain-containing protein n=1 Tax=Desulfofervidus auxilii TaxID=1621989 RepID=A0A7C0YAC9_DESA2|nr:DUF429 domain-containing protein [Candidatus Desulfofervidus auxilii]